MWSSTHMDHANIRFKDSVELVYIDITESVEHAGYVNSKINIIIFSKASKY